MNDRTARANAREQALRLLLWVLAAIQVATRLPLLHWHPGEYTDGIIQLTLLSNENAYYPPLYGLLAQAVHLAGFDLLASGRLVSVLAAALVVWPAAELGRRLGGRRGAAAAAVLWCVVPIANRWAVHAMSDLLFTLWFAWSIVFFLRGWDRPGDKRPWPQLFLGFAGLAALTRVHGVLLAPGVFVLLFRSPGVSASTSRLKTTALALVPWAVLVAWWSVRGLQVGAFETDRFSIPLGHLVWLFAGFALGFARWVPFGLGYLISALAVAGAWSAWRRDRPLLYVTLALGLAWWALHTWQLSFQLRYFVPLVPLFAALAAGGLVLLARRVASHRLAAPLALAACAGLGLAFSAGVIWHQRDSWAALAETARALADVPKGTRILADEVYDPANPPNIKVRFFAGRNDILYLYESMHQQPQDLRRDLRPGDVVMLNCLFSNIPYQYTELSQRFQPAPIAGSQRTLRPLLPDMMAPPRQWLLNRPDCMRSLGQSQVFSSVAYLLQPIPAESSGG